jgi:hypothetical protein
MTDTISKDASSHDESEALRYWGQFDISEIDAETETRGSMMFQRLIIGINLHRHLRMQTLTNLHSFL